MRTPPGRKRSGLIATSHNRFLETGMISASSFFYVFEIPGRGRAVFLIRNS